MLPYIDTNQLEPLITEAVKMFTEFEKYSNDRTPLNSKPTDGNDKMWSYKVDLSSYPTKAEDLHVSLTEKTLTLSGKSEVTSENDLKVFSTHIWSKDIEVPTRLVKTTLKAKLTENDQVVLTGELHDSSIDITVNLTEAEMD